MAVRLSAPRDDRPLPPGRFLVLISVRGWVDPRAIVAAGRIRSIEKSSDLIGDRTSDLPVCSVVPQPTTLCIKYSFMEPLIAVRCRLWLPCYFTLNTLCWNIFRSYIKDSSHKINNMNELHKRIIWKTRPACWKQEKRETETATGTNFQSAYIGEPHYITLVQNCSGVYGSLY
jgi:hypothetical protein